MVKPKIAARRENDMEQLITFNIISSTLQILEQLITYLLSVNSKQLPVAFYQN